MFPISFAKVCKILNQLNEIQRIYIPARRIPFSGIMFKISKKFTSYHAGNGCSRSTTAEYR